MASKLPTYADSIASAAAMLSEAGIPCKPADLKKAKAAGCKGFKGSRVYFAEVEKWLADNLSDDPADDELEDKDTLERRKLREQFLRLREQRERDNGKFIAKTEAATDALSAATAVRGEVMKFINDLPSLAGATPEQMHAKGLEWLNGDLCEALDKAQSYK